MVKAIDFGFTNIFDGSINNSINYASNQGLIDYNRQKSVSPSTLSQGKNVAEYHWLNSFGVTGYNRLMGGLDNARDIALGHEILSPSRLQSRYGSEFNFNRPMGAIEAERYVSRQKRMAELDDLSRRYMGNSTVGGVVSFGATILGGGLDILAVEAITLGTAPLIAGLGGAALRGASSLKWVGRAVNAGTKAMEAPGLSGAVSRFAIQKAVPHLVANTAESLAFDPLYGKLSADTGSIKDEDYGAFVRNNMLLNIGIGTVASLGVDTAISAASRSRGGTRSVARAVGEAVDEAVPSPARIAKASTSNPLVQDGKLNLSAINTRVKESFGGGDLNIDDLEMELDARSRGFLGGVDMAESPFNALTPTKKTLGDVLDGGADDVFADIDLQARRVNQLADSPNGFKRAIQDLYDEGATPQDVVSALEAYDLIGGHTPTRFQELVDEGLSPQEGDMLSTTMNEYFGKKARIKEAIQAEATLDASDKLRVGSSVYDDVAPIAKSPTTKISSDNLLADSEKAVRDIVDRQDYDKPVEERRKMADALLVQAKAMAVKDLDSLDMKESILGLSLEGVNPPEATAIAQLFNQPDDVIQAAINCLAKGD
jgi:hypothetical protein